MLRYQKYFCAEVTFPASGRFNDLNFSKVLIPLLFQVHKRQQTQQTNNHWVPTEMLVPCPEGENKLEDEDMLSGPGEDGVTFGQDLLSPSKEDGMTSIEVLFSNPEEDSVTFVEEAGSVPGNNVNNSIEDVGFRNYANCVEKLPGEHNVTSAKDLESRCGENKVTSTEEPVTDPGKENVTSAGDLESGKEGGTSAGELASVKLEDGVTYIEDPVGSHKEDTLTSIKDLVCSFGEDRLTSVENLASESGEDGVTSSEEQVFNHGKASLISVEDKESSLGKNKRIKDLRSGFMKDGLALAPVRARATSPEEDGVAFFKDLVAGPQTAVVTSVKDPVCGLEGERLTSTWGLVSGHGTDGSTVDAQFISEAESMTSAEDKSSPGKDAAISTEHKLCHEIRVTSAEKQCNHQEDIFTCPEDRVSGTVEDRQTSNENLVSEEDGVTSSEEAVSSQGKASVAPTEELMTSLGEDGGNFEESLCSCQAAVSLYQDSYLVCKNI